MPKAGIWDDRCRSAIDGLTRECRAVGVLSFERDEDMTWLDRARIVGDTCHDGAFGSSAQRIGPDEAVSPKHVVERGYGAHRDRAVAGKRDETRYEQPHARASSSEGEDAREHVGSRRCWVGRGARRCRRER